MIKIICVGKKHDAIYEQAISHFEKRLKTFVKLEWRLIPHSALGYDAARKDESTRILGAVNQTDYVVLLDENGAVASSPEISGHIEQAQNSSRDICFVIGGAYGVSEQIKNRASFCLSFGRAVFPHQLMRILVLEQIYRAYSILAGGKYHHE